MRWLWPRSRKLRAALFVGALAGCYVAAAVGTHLYVRAFLLPKIHSAANDLSRYEPRILNDLKLLIAHPVYADLPREKNAERLLSGFISWSGAGIAPLEGVEHDRLLSLMKKHEQAAQSDDEWAALLDDDELEELNLAWVDQLTAYDHIDFGSNPAYADLLKRVEHSHGLARLEIAGALPFPATNELRFAALARVAQLQLENRLPEARSLYRHVGYLLSTTDSLIGTMSAAVMLQNEKSLAERTEEAWPAIDGPRIGAMQRTAWAWGGIEQIGARQGSFGAFESYFKRSTNACAGMHELFGMENTLQDYLSPTAFLEFDLNERLTQQKQFKRRLLFLCDHDDLDVFLRPIAESDSPLLLTRWKPNPARVPFLRRILGLNLLITASPDYFRLYEDNPRQPASSK